MDYTQPKTETTVNMAIVDTLKKTQLSILCWATLRPPRWQPAVSWVHAHLNFSPDWVRSWWEFSDESSRVGTASPRVRARALCSRNARSLFAAQLRASEKSLSISLSAFIGMGSIFSRWL